MLLVAAGGRWPPDFAAWGPADWTALAGWVTATIALVASTIALLQLRHARRLRREQAQPYVVAYMEPMVGAPEFVELVVRNFGATIARDVRISATPALRRTVQGGDPEDVWLPEYIPALVPSQEWRTLWDFSPERTSAALPDRHEVVVSYQDSKNKKLPDTPSVLDWGAYRGRSWIERRGLHDAAEALREIAKITKKWNNSIHGGLKVYVRDGDAADQRQRAFAESLQQRPDRQNVQPGTGPPEPAGPGGPG